MQGKGFIVDKILVLLLSVVVIFAWMTQAAMGLWEPWEATTVLLARQMSQSSFVEMAFWVPQFDGEIVSRPYLQLWLLAIVHMIYQDPSAFFLRLPGALVAVYLTVLTFTTVRQLSSRRVAWLTVIVLLTMPMFVFGGKLVHGGIWIVFAVTLPILRYFLATYANTLRMTQIMQTLFAFSFLVAFLSGGFFALAILLLIFSTFFFCIRSHPQRESFYRPILTKYFTVPLYLSFLFIVLCFGQYTIHVRAALEGRQALSLSMLNEALEEGRVEEIQFRGSQIIGKMRAFDSSYPPRLDFVLAESEDGFRTKANDILIDDELGRRHFEKLLLAQFSFEQPPKMGDEVAAFDGALGAAFRFFWRNSMGMHWSAEKRLARVSLAAIEAHPRAAFLHKDAPMTVSTGMSVPHGDDAKGYLGEFRGGEIVEVIEGGSSEVMAKVRYQGQEAYVDKLALIDLDSNAGVKFSRWAWILGYGLFPWFAFFPLFLGVFLLPQRHMPINVQPYRLNFMSYELDDMPSLRSPLQTFLLIWFLLGIIALFIGTNFTQHYSYVGMVPAAILLAFVMSTPKLWTILRSSFELRFLSGVGAFLLVGYVVYELIGSPFLLIQYLLADPHIHWPSSSTSFENLYKAYIPVFALLCIFSFSPRVEHWRKHIYSHFRTEKEGDSNTTRQNLGSKTPLRTLESEKCPVFLLLTTAVIASLFIYFVYFPAVSKEMTENLLVERYVELANDTEYPEKLYIFHDETTALCRTYRDCDPGYICQDETCKVSLFSGYSLGAAHDITQDELLEQLNPEGLSEAAFFIIPKDFLLAINQSYRRMFADSSQRRNIYVTDAQSSRLYLISNDKGREEASLNPYDAYFLNELPESANSTKFTLSDSIELEGFRIDKFDWKTEGSLDITFFYRLKRPIYELPKFEVQAIFPSRTLKFKRNLFDGKFSAESLVEGDLLADSAQFTFVLAPMRGLVDLKIGIKDENRESASHHLTAIDF